MREVELEPAAELGVERGFAELVVDEAQVAGVGRDVASQKLTQCSVRDNKAPPVTLESKTRGAVPFVIREGGVEAGGRFGRDIERDAPTLHFVARELQRVRCGCGRRHGVGGHGATAFSTAL